MIGAIIGDIVGSRFEFDNTNTTDFELFTSECDFTDDTICTIAIADAIIKGISYKDSLVEWCRRYPNPQGSYGGMFGEWIYNPEPYNSWGNGSAMRVSPIGWAFDTLEQTLEEAEKSAIVSHNHPQGIKGAVCVAHAIYAIRTAQNKAGALEAVADKYYPEWGTSSVTHFDESCQGTLPICLRSVIFSSSYVDAIRTAIACGGDSDTIGAITGAIAEALHEIPTEIYNTAYQFLDKPISTVVDRFNTKFLRNY